MKGEVDAKTFGRNAMLFNFNDTMDDHEEEDDDDIRDLSQVCVGALIALDIIFDKPKVSRRTNGKVICRARRTVESVMYELGGLTRRYFQMKRERAFGTYCI